MTVRMKPAGMLAGIGDKMHQSHATWINASKKQDVPVSCFPQYAIMAAINVSHVDYLSVINRR